MNQMTGLEPREPDSHKGDFGRILFIGGSRDMSGAIAMSASAALRSGAGLVTVATADSAQSMVANHNPCYMTVGIAEDGSGLISASADEVHEAVKGLGNFDVIAIGPGLGQSESLALLVNEIYREYDGLMVIDADGLNNLTSLNGPAGVRVLTPHPGEFKAMISSLGYEVFQDRSLQEQQARDLAAEFGVILVLKGNASLVTNGIDSYYNSTGNPGMATAGSGDVLTGVIASLLAQQFEPINAALMGAYLHGLAGDLAVEDIGEISLIATDLIEYLPAAFQQYQAES